MSSAMVAEQSQAPFPTTLGFKATTGFSLSAGQPSAGTRTTNSQAAQLPPRPAHQQKAANGGSQPSSLAAQVAPPKTPQSNKNNNSVSEHGSFGWKGLLEISRTSGASGVVGVRSTADDEGTSTRDCMLEVCATAHTNPAIRRLVKSVTRGLKACQEPEKAQEGMGGTYFFVNESGRKVAIMKPCDEEPLAPNNPKGYVGRALGDPGWKPTVRVGEAAMREVAAYLLDHDGFAKVPTSVLVRARHPIFCYNNRMSSVRASSFDLGSGYHAQLDEGVGPAPPLPMKLGSLQEFVSHECDTSEMGSSRFSVSDVHRIGILDIRLFNTDRHAGNMLVRSSRESCVNLSTRMGSDTLELIPIDHGFCLPETLEAPYFEWLHWPQAMQPFTEEELAYIRNLDIEADKELLRKELPNLRPECLRVLELGTTLLKRGAEQGLTLFEIATAMSRPFGETDEEPSELEKIVAQAKHSMEMQKIAEEDDECCSSSDYDEEEDRDSFDDGDDGNSSLEFELELHPDSSQRNNDAGAMASGNGAGSMLGRILAAAGNSVATPVANKDREHMMFDLDEDTTAVKSTRFMEAGSPSQFSGSSSVSSTDILGSLGLVSSDATSAATLMSGLMSHGGLGGVVGGASGGSGAAGVMHIIAQGEGEAPTTPFARNVARSVCATDGFLWRRMKSRHQVNVLTKRRTSRKGEGPNSPAPQAYPPPVLAGLTLEGCSVSFTDMDEPQWGRFMRLVEDGLNAALHAGRWKQGAKAYESVASSCPRF